MAENKPKKENAKEDWTGRLIDFFRKFRGRRPKPEAADYSGWNPSEAQYQEEQAAWLASVKRRKREKRRREKEDAERKSD